MHEPDGPATGRPGPSTARLREPVAASSAAAASASGWLVLATRSFAGLVLAVGGLLAGCGGTLPASPPATGAGATVPGVGATAPAGPQGEETGVTWLEATIGQASGPEGTSAPAFCSPCHAAQETSLAGVAAGHGRLVAVGIQFPPPDAAAWTSTDGRTWRRAGGLEAPRGSVLNAVVATGGGFVAVGGAGTFAAAWTSSDDGTSWNLAHVGTPAAPGTARMDAVATFAGGLVAAGDAEVAPPAGRAVAWTSVDGTDWTPAPDIASFAQASISGLVSDGLIVVAVGSLTDADGTHTAATWWSRDGRVWHAGAPNPSFVGSRLLAVATGGPGFVAVGTADGGLRAAAWTSMDGIHWRASSGGAGFTDYGQRIAMAGVTRVGTGFVAAGWRDSAGNGSSVVWVSPDGVAWERVPDVAGFAGSQMAGVTAEGARPVAVGAIGIPDNWASAVWLGPSVSPAPPPAPAPGGSAGG